MKRIVLSGLLTVATLGCNGPALVGLVGDTPEMRDFVAQAWAGAGPIPRYSIIVLENPNAACNTARPDVDGCVKGSGLIVVNAAKSEERKAMIVLHEIGHRIRGDGRHLPCPSLQGDDVMCEAGGWDGVLPTERDLEFVR